MSLPDAPFAGEGFTVRDQEKSKDFHVRILGGKVIKPENPCYIKLANCSIVLNSGGGQDRTRLGTAGGSGQAKPAERKTSPAALRLASVIS